jgi:hypothetical protein
MPKHVPDDHQDGEVPEREETQFGVFVRVEQNGRVEG